MITLVLNSGSSSLKFSLYKIGKKTELIAKGHADGIKQKFCKFSFNGGGKNIGQKFPIKSHKEALRLALKTLKTSKCISSYKEISAVGHRVVAGGEKYQSPVKIDQNVIKQIEKLCDLAPLHNPANLEGILAVKELLPGVKQIAVFDTAFHQTMPEKAFLYGVPYEWYEKYGIRRYGFHGTNHEHVVAETIKFLKKKNQKIISCHLGNGSSITATLNGKVVDTSMGLSPLEGIIMGTRSGSIDPTIIFHMAKTLKIKKIEKIEEILNQESGLLGLSKLSSDMRPIYLKSSKGDKFCKLTIEILSYQIAKYIGAYAASLSGLDAITFTGGLGEKAFYVRAEACKYLEYLGVKIDPKKNENCEMDITGKGSKVKIFVIPANEEEEIAVKTAKILAK